MYKTRKNYALREGDSVSIPVFTASRRLEKEPCHSYGDGEALFYLGLPVVKPTGFLRRSFEVPYGDPLEGAVMDSLLELGTGHVRYAVVPSHGPAFHTISLSVVSGGEKPVLRRAASGGN